MSPALPFNFVFLDTALILVRCYNLMSFRSGSSSRWRILLFFIDSYFFCHALSVDLLLFSTPPDFGAARNLMALCCGSPPRPFYSIVLHQLLFSLALFGLRRCSQSHCLILAWHWHLTLFLEATIGVTCFLWLEASSVFSLFGFDIWEGICSTHTL